MQKKSHDEQSKDLSSSRDREKKEGSSSDPWINLCAKTTIKELIKSRHKKLITIDRHATVRQALKILNREDILSAPIVDNKEHIFLGFIDVLDIAGYVLATWRQLSRHLDDANFPGEQFFETNVSEVLNFSDVNYPVFINEHKTVLDLIEIFRSPKNFYRLHRVAVTSDDDDVINVISQSDVVKFAALHMSELPAEKVNMQVGLMKGLIRSPIMISIDSAFVDALERLYKNRISGLALVDHEFKLSGNLSASDLRGMNVDGFDFFFGSTLQFLAKGTTSGPKRTMKVGTGNTFGEVIKILAEEKIHRIYITTEGGNPMGFISLIDVIVRL